ncbi:glutamine--fructose-6-phosphate aminotransferase [Candidatus Roizmanbacteria bacterium RIFCSPLOWO2_01_FULL_41_22]|uniref:Glutamine--fructose-6-phosphate aminotransferase [isomerizing] n=2 Tax=Candidatus Roizmaniibacteriota TaxID=1752723 RepID=A0A1F7JS49_9BACT|nr:MAG: glutamine--fructose-6-phosphate aminotransferase [Candidatus Roizmanbacteria bacterium RIFCSPLOWO2_01_FULL_41_22]OGK58428.1 MAG: glutamine--fructose-6-phosphate aminotransferase [Candidatus Roizmanbacteria bacterium RIFCSPLOWO2_02_FULL_41_9]
MCGIFAYVGKKQNAGDLIMEGLKALEYRGYDSWGVAVKKQDGQIYLEKHVGKIGQAKLPRLSSTIGIGHTRWATHGGVTRDNAHPHTDCTGNIIIVHNGIVENYTSLKKQLLKKGHIFKSETDTEVIAHWLEEKKKTDNDPLKLMRGLASAIKGMSAVIAFFPEEEVLYVYKYGSPIVFGQNNDGLYLASDPSAMILHTKQVYFLEDNEMLQLGRSGYELYDGHGEIKKITFTTLAYDQEDALLGKYPYFMLKEIHEQPKVIQNIIDTQASNITKVAEFVKKADGTYFIGCGSAYHVSLSGAYLFSKIANRHVNAAIASEFSYLESFIKNTSLVVAFSQSGETIDLISCIRKAQENKAKILAVTNVPGSTLYRMADHRLLLQAGPEKAVATTKAYTAKIAIIYLLAHELAGTIKKAKEDLRLAVSEIQRFLKNTDKIKKMAEQFVKHEHVFILGRGVSYPTALESALKIKEVSYCHAEGFAASELKHGVIALVQKGTPIIVYNPADETYQDALSSAHEVKARGAYVIGISSKNNPIYDDFIEVKDCHEATIIPNVTVAQLLGYYLALAKGYDPDKPRNLAKSVTVK